MNYTPKVLCPTFGVRFNFDEVKLNFLILRESFRRLLGVFTVTSQRICDNPLYLTVDRAEFLSCPSFDESHCFRVESQQEAFALLFSHWQESLLIECPCVQHRLSWFVSAEHDEQIAHHRSFAFFVEFDNVFFFQLLKSHFHH